MFAVHWPAFLGNFPSTVSISILLRRDAAGHSRRSFDFFGSTKAQRRFFRAQEPAAAVNRGSSRVHVHAHPVPLRPPSPRGASSGGRGGNIEAGVRGGSTQTAPQLSQHRPPPPHPAGKRWGEGGPREL
jgi:hypothetical protein|eukprot:COSAG01_NODE_2687_length_7249_cov_105.374406_8_plen_129_part_00